MTIVQAPACEAAPVTVYSVDVVCLLLSWLIHLECRVTPDGPEMDAFVNCLRANVSIRAIGMAIPEPGQAAIARNVRRHKVCCVFGTGVAFGWFANVRVLDFKVTQAREVLALHLSTPPLVACLQRWCRRRPLLYLLPRLYAGITRLCPGLPTAAHKDDTCVRSEPLVPACTAVGGDVSAQAVDEDPLTSLRAALCEVLADKRMCRSVGNRLTSSLGCSVVMFL